MDIASATVAFMRLLLLVVLKKVFVSSLEKWTYSLKFAVVKYREIPKSDAANK